MKIVWIGTFNYAQVLEVVNFLETQQTSDREKEKSVIEWSADYGDYKIKIEVNRHREIEKIIIRSVKWGK